MPKASSNRHGARLRFPVMSKPCWRRPKPYEESFPPRLDPAISLALVFLAPQLDRQDAGGRNAGRGRAGSTLSAREGDGPGARLGMDSHHLPGKADLYP